VQRAYHNGVITLRHALPPRQSHVRMSVIEIKCISN
jgi:hypothetical protein